jgi:hypothetical protein
LAAENPNPKIQIPRKSQGKPKHQIPKFGAMILFEIWDLKIVWNLGFGFWNFRAAVVPQTGR